MDDVCTVDESQMPMAQVLARPGMAALKVDFAPSGRIVAITERHAVMRLDEDDQPAIVPWQQVALHGVGPAPAALPQDVVTRDRQDKLAEALRHLLTIEEMISTDRAAIHQFWHELLALSGHPTGTGDDNADRR